MTSPSRTEKIGHTTRNPKSSPATKCLLNARASMLPPNLGVVHDCIAKERGDEMTPQFGVRKSVGVRWARGSGRMNSNVRCGIDAGLAARAGFYAERARPFDLRRTRS